MMRKSKNDAVTDSQFAKLKLLESWGFLVHHGFSRISHTHAPDINFDFSATADEQLVSEAIRIAFKLGQAEGANELRAQFAKLMSPIDKD